MSLSKHRAFSKHSTTRHELPFWWSLRLASSITSLLELSVKEGLQTEGLGGQSPSGSFEIPEKVLFFCWPLVVQVSLAGG